MERPQITYQWLEESGEVDFELFNRLLAKRKANEPPPFFFDPPKEYRLTGFEYIMITTTLSTT